MRSVHWLVGALAFVALPACAGGSGEATVTGTVAGNNLNVGSVYWGGPYIVITGTEYTCKDMGWVRNTYTEENPPGDDDKTFLQFSFQGEEVAVGFFDVTGESQVNADFWTYGIDDGVDNYRARSGQLDVDEINNDQVTGTFTLLFDDGELEGTLDGIEWCTNLKG